MTLLPAILVTFAILLMVIAGMAIGVMNGRRPISGSCGGLNNGGCELCSGDGKCARESEQ
jgi:hypothetical protein